MVAAAGLRTGFPPATWGRMTMCDHMGASHAFLGQPGGLRLLLRGESLADLVTEGGRALGAHLCGHETPSASSPWQTVEIHAGGREAVLAHWLNRLLYLAGRDGWAPLECRVIAVSDGHLRARVRGVPLPVRPHPGKAAIRPGSFISPCGHGLQAEVILQDPWAVPGHRTGKPPASAGRKGRD